MRLLTGRDILQLVQTPAGSLKIDNFDLKQLQHTAYYVRLGARFSRMSDELVDPEDYLSESSPFLRFGPGEYIRVWSHETFNLDARVMGILGGVSDTPRLGLALISGQFIDPLYPIEAGTATAPLEFGLKNETQLHAAIRLHDNVGKICFFDVSDSTDIHLIPGSRSHQQFESRIRRANEVEPTE